MRIQTFIANLMASLSGMLIHILLFFSLGVFGKSKSHEKIPKAPKIRVGFVFAGGVRSFILPEIHESIRQNLIHSFCPPSICIGDVFVRLSIDDNTHVGMGANALGKKIDGTPEEKALAMKAVKKLSHVSPEAKFVLRVVNIGSKEEAKEMDVVTSKDFKQKIYRDLDPRRYSMYFNRAAAYDMLVKEETSSRKPYTWVVHARLDAGWGEPIRPFYMWSQAKVWSPDSWYADVADNFLLLPRNRSEIFYSLKMQYTPDKVMCVGGTNFDPKTMEDGPLRARGYTPAQIEMAKKENCFAMFDQSGFIVTYEREVNITWTSAGTSEVYLKRKLAHYGISIEQQTLGFTSLMMFVSRFPLQFLCFWIEPSYFIPWVKEWQHCSDPVGVGCNGMMNDMSYLYETSRSTSCDLKTLSSKYPLSTVPRSTCLLDKKMTDWNYMPFRIRRRGNSCLTTYYEGQNTLNMTSCIDSMLKPDTYVHDYDDTQLFSLYPMSPTPQRIAVYHFRRGAKCLTVVSQGDTHALEMQHCSNEPTASSQHFIVQLVSTKAAKGAPGVAHRRPYVPVDLGHGPNSTLSRVRRAMQLAAASPPGAVVKPSSTSLDAMLPSVGSRGGEGRGRGPDKEALLSEFSPLLPDYVFAVIEWVGPTGNTEKRQRLCLNLMDEKTESAASSAVAPKVPSQDGGGPVPSRGGRAEGAGGRGTTEGPSRRSPEGKGEGKGSKSKAIASLAEALLDKLKGRQQSGSRGHGSRSKRGETEEDGYEDGYEEEEDVREGKGGRRGKGKGKGESTREAAGAGGGRGRGRGRGEPRRGGGDRVSRTGAGAGAGAGAAAGPAHTMSGLARALVAEGPAKPLVSLGACYATDEAAVGKELGGKDGGTGGVFEQLAARRASVLILERSENKSPTV